MADWYVTQSGAGAQDGTSLSDAWAASDFNTAGNWGAGGDQISPGDTVHLSGTISTALSVQASGTAGNITTILFDTDAKLSAASFPASIGASGGAIYADAKEYIKIDGGSNGIIECTDNGSAPTYGNQDLSVGIHIDGGAHWKVVGLTIQNMYIALDNEGPTSQYTAGVMIYQADNVEVSRCSIDNCAYGVRTSFADTSGVEVHDCAVKKCGLGIYAGISSNGVSADNYHLHHNWISDSTPWSYNDGIKVVGRNNNTDHFTRVNIHHNVLGPNLSQASHPATACILVRSGWYIAPQIHHNVCIGNSGDNFGNALIALGGVDPAYEAGIHDMRGRVYNNVLYTAQTATEIMLYFTDQVQGMWVYNNIFVAAGKVRAIYLGDTDHELIVCDRNFYDTDGDLEFRDGDESILSFAEWKALGHDPNSIEGIAPWESTDLVNPAGPDDKAFSGNDSFVAAQEILNQISPLDVDYVGAFPHPKRMGAKALMVETLQARGFHVCHS